MQKKLTENRVKTEIQLTCCYIHGKHVNFKWNLSLSYSLTKYLQHPFFFFFLEEINTNLFSGGKRKSSKDAAHVFVLGTAAF